MAEKVLRETRQFQFTRKAALNRSHVSLLVFSARFTPLTVGGGSFCCQREGYAIHSQRPQPELWPDLQHHTRCQCQELHGPVWRRLWSEGAVLHLQGVFPPSRDQPTLQKRFSPQLPGFSVAQLKHSRPPSVPAKPLQIAHEITGKSSAAISWRKAETAEQQAGFVVEWYPEGHKLEELQWIRLGINDSRALLTGGTRKTTTGRLK